VTILKDIKTMLAQREAESGADVTEYRRIHLERIDRALFRIWPKVAQGDLDAIDRMLRLLEREARLLGLDAPTKIDLAARIRALASAEGWDADEAVATGAQVAKVFELKAGGA
jgi:hypothetical protein